jgi:hypothetical protein
MGNYSWQVDTNTRLPGSAVFVAHQFLRCVLHQLAPNNVFLQIFLQRTPGNAPKARMELMGSLHIVITS